MLPWNARYFFFPMYNVTFLYASIHSMTFPFMKLHPQNEVAQDLTRCLSIANTEREKRDVIIEDMGHDMKLLRKHVEDLSTEKVTLENLLKTERESRVKIQSQLSECAQQLNDNKETIRQKDNLIENMEEVWTTTLLMMYVYAQP